MSKNMKQMLTNLLIASGKVIMIAYTAGMMFTYFVVIPVAGGMHWCGVVDAITKNTGAMNMAYLGALGLYVGRKSAETIAGMRTNGGV